jgi:hypothetical protein
MAQADDPQQFTGVQRKGTGFVPTATAGAAAGVSACRMAVRWRCAGGALCAARREPSCL